MRGKPHPSVTSHLEQLGSTPTERQSYHLDPHKDPYVEGVLEHAPTHSLCAGSVSFLLGRLRILALQSFPVTPSLRFLVSSSLALHHLSLPP